MVTPMAKACDTLAIRWCRKLITQLQYSFRMKAVLP